MNNYKSVEYFLALTIFKIFVAMQAWFLLNDWKYGLHFKLSVKFSWFFQFYYFVFLFIQPKKSSTIFSKMSENIRTCILADDIRFLLLEEFWFFRCIIFLLGISLRFFFVNRRTELRIIEKHQFFRTDHSFVEKINTFFYNDSLLSLPDF